MINERHFLFSFDIYAESNGWVNQTSQAWLMTTRYIFVTQNKRMKICVFVGINYATCLLKKESVHQSSNPYPFFTHSHQKLLCAVIKSISPFFEKRKSKEIKTNAE
ncbi:unnamed protein product [Orchesella dallaii]|uniref:Uncharacterized protein n=1 Tax=Orchesella dallaii TaxID=48710 RepID=A0ABP1RTQ9_9HEXA